MRTTLRSVVAAEPERAFTSGLLASVLLFSGLVFSVFIVSPPKK